MADNDAERRRWSDDRWEQVWPKREQLTDAVSDRLLRALDVQSGERVLDIGCGGGRLSLRLAEQAGPSGSVVGADISPSMVRLASRRATAAGLAPNRVRFGVLDVQHADIDGAPFDVAASQFGVMFFDRPEAAFANIGRQLRRGGRLAFACWQAAERNPWYFAPQVADLVPTPPPRAPGRSPTGPFSLADPGWVWELLAGAGFDAIDRDAFDLEVDAPADAVVDASQIAFLGVRAEDQAEAEARAVAHLEQFRLPSGDLRYPLAVQVFRARWP